MSTPLRSVPARATAGVYILHSGLEKWRADDATAAGLHGMATAAYPFLAQVPAPRFVKALAAAEIGIGAALVTPMVSNRVAGAALTAFAGSLLGLYARVPGLRRPGSIWPTPDGLGVSKDVWLLGAGLSLAADDGAQAA